MPDEPLELPPLPDTADELARAFGEAMERSAEPAKPAMAAPVEESTAPPPPERIVEAMLFIGGPPLTPERAAEVVRGLTPERLAQAVEQLNRSYRAGGRPCRIQPRDQGYELALIPRYRGVMERLYGAARESRLSPQALDVLALVAYRQPATRPEIESLRGADCSGLLRQLIRLGLVAVQRAEAGQKEVSYGTTGRFLKLFSLRSLDDLPRTEDLQRL